MNQFTKNLTAKILAALLIGVSFFLEMIREVFLAENKNIREIVLIISTYILLYLFLNYLENLYKTYRIKKYHYPKSFGIVLKDILPSYLENSKSFNSHSIEHNNTVDRIIKSPIDYTNETLSGNQAPVFKPNETYLEDIYNDDLSHIVAITAENPNLWIDPTLSFFMINCCAVTLINKFNSNATAAKKFKMSHLSNDKLYSDYVKIDTADVLRNLNERKDLSEFEFVRFILFSEEQKDCLKHTVFPSLKATQDLFRIKSFFLQNDKIKENLKSEYDIYTGFINALWDRIIEHHKFEDSKILEIIKRRKEKHIPEFLILFKKNKQVIIHTYINGNPYQTPLNNHSKGVNSDYAAATNLIAYLANCRLQKENCDWFPTTTEKNLNSKNTYIDWN
jgi:hypothetical protein